MKKILTPKQEFDQQCARAFEAIALFDERVAPQRIQDACLALASQEALEPGAIDKDAAQKIKQALSMHPQANLGAALASHFEAAKLARESLAQGAMTPQARRKAGHGVSADEHYFAQAYAAACGQEAARMSFAAADRGDASAIEAIPAKLEGALGDLYAHPRAQAHGLFSSKLEGLAQRLERAQIGRDIQQAAPAGPKTM